MQYSKPKFAILVAGFPAFVYDDENGGLGTNQLAKSQIDTPWAIMHDDLRYTTNGVWIGLCIFVQWFQAPNTAAI